MAQPAFLSRNAFRGLHCLIFTYGGYWSTRSYWSWCVIQKRSRESLGALKHRETGSRHVIRFVVSGALMIPNTQWTCAGHSTSPNWSVLYKYTTRYVVIFSQWLITFTGVFSITICYSFTPLHLLYSLSYFAGANAFIIITKQILFLVLECFYYLSKGLETVLVKYLGLGEHLLLSRTFLSSYHLCQRLLSDVTVAAHRRSCGSARLLQRAPSAALRAGSDAGVASGPAARSAAGSRLCPCLLPATGAAR